MPDPDQARSSTQALDFEAVLAAELDEIAQRRGSEAERATPDGAPAPERAADMKLIGLALSGGGVRSATSCLGLLQAMAERGWLAQIDYLSTVSGGGFIGSWLAAMIHRTQPASRAEAAAHVAATLDAMAQDNPVHRLRRLGNYLTPEVGLLSRDTWIATVTYLRNLAINLVIWVSLATLIIVVARLLSPLGGLLGASVGGRVFCAVAAASLVAVAFVIGHNADSIGEGSAQRSSNQGAAVLLGAGLLFHYGVVATTRPAALLVALPGVHAWGPLLLPVASLTVALAISALVVGHRAQRGTRRPEPGETMVNFTASAVLVCGSWLIIASASLYAAELLDLLQLLAHGYDLTPLAVLGWAGTTLTGLLGDRARNLGPRARDAVALVVTLAPHVFLYGLFFFVSAWIEWWPAQTGEIDWPRLLLAGGGLVAVISIIAATADINELSMHAFYRDQLAVAYLGEGELDPPMPVNDVELSELVGERGPFLIVNASCALSSDGQLAWQERRATSFTITPLHWGYDATLVDRERDGAPPPSPALGYRPLAGSGIQLRTAVAISAAAASPHMGRYGSPTLAGLLTVFNVRLGSWMPNPRLLEPGARPPTFALRGLLQELLGRSSSDRPHIYLSDGGHFENLGIYELVRRRCRYIVAYDATGDAEFEFAVLGVAIRLCRIDFGVDIDIDTSSIAALDEHGHSLAHCAVGTIDYGPREAPGVLVYIKNSLTGDEPRDVRSYAAAHDDFPDEWLGDQFFGESQFESYRQLGLHIGRCVFEELDGASAGTDLADRFEELRQTWYAGVDIATPVFTRQSQRLEAVYDELRGDPDLDFLIEQIFVEWGTITTGRGRRRPQLLWPWRSQSAEHAPTPTQLRKGFLLCCSALRLMESVYLDLDLERTAGHPDLVGWMNVFSHWGASAMFRVTWAASASTFGARFRRFGERQFGLQSQTLLVATRLEPGDEGEPEGEPRHVSALSLMEHRLVEAVSAAEELPDYATYCLQLRVGPPAYVAGDDQARDVEFGVGLAFVREGCLEFLRVRDHLVSMGLGKRAMAELLRAGLVDRCPEGDFEIVELLRRSQYANYVGRFDAARFRRMFKSVEATVKTHAAGHEAEHL